MAGKQTIEETIRRALESQSPEMLKGLFKPSLSWDEMLELRERVSRITIEPQHYSPIFDWLWHPDPLIARAARIFVHFGGDQNLHIEIFTRLAQVVGREMPFVVSYDVGEKEFSVDLPGVPGWGVSHYGRDNPDTDRLLKALERIYANAHPTMIPPYFRT